ncbi:DUF4166 domain-containing protein [Pseudoprimorskyibacter insulae]|uniref:DUF4166 domain-containing protein n=1 Tax=Pseudoprimorskyibacter insulae TaxID=1695997 RepID=UPI0015E8383E|nr:DUF4166 domain-containing protein [Pseudoprimorskyibacter insulae]
MRSFHETIPARYTGQVSVIHGRSWLARTMARLAGFPDAAADLPFQLDVEEQDGVFKWTRQFGLHTSVSHAWLEGDHVCEKFGPFRLLMHSEVNGDRLKISIDKMIAFGINLPDALTPKSESVESLDEAGRYVFDISAYSPWEELLVRYNGWMVPSPLPL